MADFQGAIQLFTRDFSVRCQPQQTKRRFENNEEHTDIESPVEDVDEAELEAELAELEAKLN